MEKSTDNSVEQVHNQREDGAESIKRTSKVVPIDSGVKKQGSVENITPTEKDEGFDQFLDKMKARNVASREGLHRTDGAKKD